MAKNSYIFRGIDTYGLQLEDIPQPFMPSPASETMDVACKPCPQNEFPVTPVSHLNVSKSLLSLGLP